MFGVAAANRQIKDKLTHFHKPVEKARSTGDHHSRPQMPSKSAAIDLISDQLESFFGPRLEDLAKILPQNCARLSSSYPFDFDRFAIVDKVGKSTTKLLFDDFSAGLRRSKSHGDVHGEVVATDRNRTGVG